MHAAPGADPVPAAGPTARALRPAEKALKTNGFCKESRSAAQAAGAGREPGLPRYYPGTTPVSGTFPLSQLSPQSGGNRIQKPGIA